MTQQGTEYRQQTQFSYRIVKEIERLGGYGDESKELNLVSFKNRPPKYDIRAWKVEDGQRTMLRGITLSKEEALLLRDALNKELKDA